MSDLISRQAAIENAFEVNTKDYGRIEVVGVDAILELPPAQPDNQVNLCDSCRYVYPECPSEKDDVIFGNGKGNDNICACNKYEPSAQPDRSLWFRIGEVCVNESKGDITAEVAIEKIRALLKAETIYCKDCKYRGSFNYCTYKTRAGWITRDNGHCSEAERREE